MVLRWAWGAVLVVGSATAGAEMPAGRQFANSLGMEFVRVEPGEFLMGCRGRTHGLPNVRPGGPAASNPEWGNFDEHPAHKVRISRAFYLGVAEVTIDQYRKFAPAYTLDATLPGGQKLRKGGRGYKGPWVGGVSWQDAGAFCRWLSK